MKGADKGIWCWACKLLSKQRRMVVRGGIKWGEVMRPMVVAPANCGQDPQWHYTQCRSRVLVMFTACIPWDNLTSNALVTKCCQYIIVRCLCSFSQAILFIYILPNIFHQFTVHNAFIHSCFNIQTICIEKLCYSLQAYFDLVVHHLRYTAGTDILHHIMTPVL